MKELTPLNLTDEHLEQIQLFAKTTRLIAEQENWSKEKYIDYMVEGLLKILS
jgi:hypothetical protein